MMHFPKVCTYLIEALTLPESSLLYTNARKNLCPKISPGDSQQKANKPSKSTTRNKQEKCGALLWLLLLLYMSKFVHGIQVYTLYFILNLSYIVSVPTRDISYTCYRDRKNLMALRGAACYSIDLQFYKRYNSWCHIWKVSI